MSAVVTQAQLAPIVLVYSDFVFAYFYSLSSLLFNRVRLQDQLTFFNISLQYNIGPFSLGFACLLHFKHFNY